MYMQRKAICVTHFHNIDTHTACTVFGTAFLTSCSYAVCTQPLLVFKAPTFVYCDEMVEGWSLYHIIRNTCTVVVTVENTYYSWEHFTSNRKMWAISHKRVPSCPTFLSLLTCKETWKFVYYAAYRSKIKLVEYLYCSVRKKFGPSFFIDVCSYVYDQDFALAPIQNKDN